MKAAKTIAEAMKQAESIYRVLPDWPAERDPWKDLTRAYTGRELNDAILDRCEKLGVNVKALRNSIDRKRNNRGKCHA